MSLDDRHHPLGQRLAVRAWALAFGLASCACTETLDAGSTKPHGILPVDERNPLIVLNDGATDNWQGEYAVLLANGGGPPLAGIVVNTSPGWPDIDANVTEWRSLVAAARQSGLGNVPDPVASLGGPLVQPATGRIEDTTPNRSEGARLILAIAAELSRPYRPVVVATGTRLTDVADAYLLDPSVADKIVVVSSLGALSAMGANMSNPNGEMDAWADLIVSKRLRYVQVSAYYDQLTDVPDSRLSELPDGAFGAWMAAKQPEIYSIAVASDQVSVLAAGFPPFVAAASRVAAPASPTGSGGPELVADPQGSAWLVTQSKGELATARLWELLSRAPALDHRVTPSPSYARSVTGRSLPGVSHLAFVSALMACGCTETLDAGHHRPYGLLPVDQRNSLIVVNDGAYDNWFGEYAVLLAGGGGKLAGIVVNASPDWPDMPTNVDGWRGLVAAARESGLENLPDPIASVGSPLVMPASGELDDTRPNRSEGARLIVDVSKRLGFPYRPLVVATGGALTDVADAYLIDPTVTERVVVVSSLGSVSSAGGAMGIPNGDGDPWADTIVTRRFRYVQVSAFYDQLTDVPAADLARLPDNPLGSWIASKQPNLWHWSPASDQVAVLAATLPTFATAVQRVSPAPSGDADAGASTGPDLLSDPEGAGLLVTDCDAESATARFWESLLRTPVTRP